jgi:hypothetical protein
LKSFVLINACEPAGSKKTENIDYGLAMSNLEESRIFIGAAAIRNKDFNIYPNPFSNKAIIEFNNSYQERYQLILIDKTSCDYSLT